MVARPVGATGTIVVRSLRDRIAKTGLGTGTGGTIQYLSRRPTPPRASCGHSGGPIPTTPIPRTRRTRHEPHPRRPAVAHRSPPGRVRPDRAAAQHGRVDEIPGGRVPPVPRRGRTRVDESPHRSRESVYPVVPTRPGDRRRAAV